MYPVSSTITMYQVWSFRDPPTGGTVSGVGRKGVGRRGFRKKRVQGERVEVEGEE